MISWYQTVVWGCFFQFSMALSRLLDVSPEAMIDAGITQVSNKGVKAMQIFETLAPIRPKETIEKEYTPKIKEAMEDQDKLQAERVKHEEEVQKQ